MSFVPLDLDSFSALSAPDQLAAMRGLAAVRPPMAPPALGEIAQWFALDQLPLADDPARVSFDRLSAAFEAVFFVGLNMGLRTVGASEISEGMPSKISDVRTSDFRYQSIENRRPVLAPIASRDGQRTTDSLALAIIRIGKCRADVCHLTGLSRDRLDAICRDGSIVTNAERALLVRVVPTWRG